MVLTCLPSETPTELECIPNDPIGFAAKFYGIGLGLIGGVSVLFIIYGGYIILSSQGNPANLNKGKSYITYALIGLLLAIFGFVFIQVVAVDVLKIPGFLDMKKLLPILFFILFLAQLFIFIHPAFAQTPGPTPQDGAWVSDSDVTFVGKVGARAGPFSQGQSFQVPDCSNQSNSPSPSPTFTTNASTTYTCIFDPKCVSGKAGLQECSLICTPK